MFIFITSIYLYLRSVFHNVTEIMDLDNKSILCRPQIARNKRFYSTKNEHKKTYTITELIQSL